MANVLTDLAADIYKAADTVGRELVGFIPAVTINAGAEAAAQGDTVRSHFTRAATVNTSATPSMTLPEGDDQTVDNKTMTVSQIASVRIPWTGEDIKHVNNGSGFETIYGDQIEQAMRGIVNAIETKVATVAYQGASRAVGTAGTTPFASAHGIVNEARQILADNGMPTNDGRVTLVMNTSAGVNFRNLSNLYKVNEAGDSRLLRQGVLTDISGIMMRESGQVQSHTAGSVTGTVTVTGANAVGATAIGVTTAAGAAVSLSAGDIVTFAGDSNKYVVASAVSIGASTTGTITIAAPGLREATAGSEAVAAGASYTGNVSLHQSAVELVMRPLAKPLGGDAAVDVMTVQDPFSGLVFQISVYKGYNKAMIDVTTLYDAKAWKPDAIANVLG
ncbi:P22 phage major capsid protein family protein [Actibacterium sp. MT2.3-13A]|uniref:P22 phage major capsid protein family protein n=1 Tax=Actibacterium sp. MT2.3-13A TaxID=2828332 RepID=UPI001BA54BE9|nr:P22 phage major capsid protein family protein [Actibacterium sp. MT2.3-13A]